MQGNELTSLPESIGNLSSLTWLYLDSNQLTLLPESFGSLSSLEELYLENNRLSGWIPTRNYCRWTDNQCMFRQEEYDHEMENQGNSTDHINFPYHVLYPYCL